jgi:GH25 family lysozyme M1 (1,4-beta-N-acetylmuramidase)
MEVENEVMENIIENVIEEVPAKEEEEEEKKEEKVKFKNKEVVIPKSKVSSANSSEDAEKSKKTGGSTVSQEQAQTMFENVGQKSMGIDVSQHQGKIDWAAVRNSGVEFAIIRVGYRGQTQGGIYEDRYFKTNMSGAIANGIKVGVYFYSTAINEEEALEEAAWVVKKIAPYSVTYPVVYDFEDFNSKRCANVGGVECTKNANAFLVIVPIDFSAHT